MKYFLGLSANYSGLDTFYHTFAFGNEYHLSELRAFLAARYGATYDHVAVYANGRTALNVALKAVTKRGGKVVVTSLTCYAVIQAVKAAGCTPIFADVDPKTLHFGAAELEKALEGETNVQAVIVQNNLGIPVDIAAIEEVAKAHKLEIVEDLAHCTGVKYADGREVGTVGRVAALSFGKGKSIDTVTGGAVVFTNPLDTPVKQPENPPVFVENLRARLYPLFSAIIRGLYGIHPKLGKYLTSFLVRTHAIKRSADGVIDSKTRLTYWQCRMALRQLKSLPRRGRQPIRDFYLVKNRDELVSELEKIGYFFSDIWYTLPVAPERYYKKADFHPETCPVAVKLAQEIVNVPTYYSLSELKPAIKLIEKYQIEDGEEVELSPEILTEAEKKAKIKAEKAERAKAKKAEKKAEKQAEKRAKKQKRDDGAPDEETPSAEKTDVIKVAKSKVGTLVARVPKRLTQKAKKEDREDDSTEVDEEVLLEETSDILSATEVEEIARSEKEIEKPVEKPAETGKTAEKPLQKLATEAKTAPAPEKPTSEVAESTDSDIGGMRIAPRKLTAREKLKLELESGKKGGPSVL